MLSQYKEDHYAFIRRTLVTARKKHRIRQSDLAKKLGVTQQFISKVETAERGIDVIEFIAMADALGLNPANVIAQMSR